MLTFTGREKEPTGTSQSGYAHGHFMEDAPLQGGLSVVFATKAAK
jgi:hypothetical protein